MYKNTSHVPHKFITMEASDSGELAIFFSKIRGIWRQDNSTLYIHGQSSMTFLVITKSCLEYRFLEFSNEPQKANTE